MLRGYLILIRFVAIIVICILASLFLEHTVYHLRLKTFQHKKKQSVKKLIWKLLQLLYVYKQQHSIRTARTALKNYFLFYTAVSATRDGLFCAVKMNALLLLFSCCCCRRRHRRRQRNKVLIRDHLQSPRHTCGRRLLRCI